MLSGNLLQTVFINNDSPDRNHTVENCANMQLEAPAYLFCTETGENQRCKRKE